MSTRLVALGAAVITAALLTACSSSGGGTGDSPTPSRTGSSTPTSSAPTSEPTSAAPTSDGASGPDEAALTGVALVAADLPSTWKAAPHDASDDGDDSDSKALLACIGARDTSADSLKKAYSQDFSMGDNSITSNAELFKTQADVTSDSAVFADAKTKSCYTAQIRKALTTSLPAGSTIGSLAVTITPGDNGGPKNVVAIITANTEVTVQGQKTAIYNDSVFITGNRIEAEVDFTGIGARIDQSTRVNAVVAVAGRAAKL